MVPKMLKGVTILNSANQLEQKSRLIFELIFFVAPAALLSLWGGGMTLSEIGRAHHYGYLSKLNLSDWVGLSSTLGGPLALVELIRLSIKTINDKIYRFGLAFYMAGLFGGVATYYLYEISSLSFTLFVSAPLVFLIVHMCILQKRVRHQ